MNSDFVSFADSSPLWIFSSPTAWTTDQERDLRESWSDFARGWLSHKQAVRSEFALLEGFFLVVVADNEGHPPSGCSIDSAYRFLTDWGNSRSLDLLDRRRAYYREPTGAIQCEALSDFKKRLRSGQLAPGLRVFQTGLSTLSEYRKGFEVSLDQSWAAAFL